MSLLSRPQGTPERVWSLVAALNALGGDLPHEDFVALINPGFTRGAVLARAETSLAGDASGATYALGLAEREGARVRLTTRGQTGGLLAFADDVHDILCAAQPGDWNTVILEAYAWLVAESHRRQDLGWLYDVGRDAFADMVDSALVGQDEDGRLMNTTKVPAWRRWLRFLGLSVPMPAALIDYPSPARRVGIELRRGETTTGVAMPAEEFVQRLGRRCPYLDRGRLFAQAAQRIDHTGSPRTLSAVLSCALRDLEAEGVIELRLSGDAADNLSLTSDSSSRATTFNAVVVRESEVRS